MTDTQTEAPPTPKRPRGEIPPRIASLPLKQQRNFERDFLREAEADPAVRRAARVYFSMGWRSHYDAVSAHNRRRKAPGECRVKFCPCNCHPQQTPVPEPNGNIVTDPLDGSRMTLGAYIDLTADFDD